MAYSRDACIEIREDRERIERAQGERESRGTIDRLQQDWHDTIYRATADGLSQTNKIARERARESQRQLERESQRQLNGAREEIWSYLDNLFTDRQTNGQTDGRTLLVPKVAIATEKQGGKGLKQI